MSLSKALTAAAGNAGAGESLYVEDVFSTYLYTGTGADQTITNGIDLDGEGGMVWIKDRDVSRNHQITCSEFDVAGGELLFTNSTSSLTTRTDRFKSFNSNGFTVGNDTGTGSSGEDYASWTFRKAEKFFDVVTYTGNGDYAQSISHNLGSVPAFVICKKTNTSGDWCVWHKGSGGSTDVTELSLNSTSSALRNNAGYSSFFTATTFDPYWVINASGGNGNESGSTYVAYLFASDAGGFGDDGSESIIKCGSFTASTGAEVDLGFEPQWVLLKSATSTADWYLVDNMRGWGADRGSNDAFLSSNASAVEFSSTNSLGLTPTGFISFNGGNETYIYIAIRRPMKTPESGTEVFKTIEQNWSTGILDAGFPVDLAIFQTTDAGNNGRAVDRLRGNTQVLYPNGTFAEGGESYYALDNNEGFELVSSPLSNNWVWWMFKRATGFFDVVAYTGDRVSEGGPQTITHNLKVVPDLVIVKERSSSDPWYIASTELNNYDYLTLNTVNQVQSDSVTPYVYDLAVNTFKVGARNQVNATGSTYIAYLFGSVAGVSKVGSFSHTQGTATNVDCGFSNGARFVLWKKYDGSDGWQVYDTVRGINAGADPFLQLNSDAAEISEDLIDPYAAGFSVASGKISGNYIFLAIA